MTRHRIAVLDDYQNVALTSADWSRLDADIHVFTHAITDPAELTAALRGFDVIVAMRERTGFPADVLTQLPELKLLVTTGSANSAIDLDARHDVTVCGTRDSGISSTVELTWGLILAAARRIPVEDAHIRNGAWQQTVGLDLKGRQLGIVGLGGVGSAVAHVGKAFGMTVAAWSPHLDPNQATAAGIRAVSKHDLFADSDVVTVHMKLTDTTRGLIDAAAIARMRAHAILVNTSRGPLVDEDYLLDALRAGTIGGAGIDVYNVEPLPPDSPWRHAPRTVLTPHLGYVNIGTYNVFFPDVVDDIAAWKAGQPIRRIPPRT